MLRGLFCLFFATVLCLKPLYAESLSVFSEDPEAKIYVNGALLGTHQLVNYEVLPGEYWVKVIVPQGVAYSQLVVVAKGDSKVLNTTRFVPAPNSTVPDRSAKLIEGDRLRLSRGNLGLGVELGPISGLTMRYDFDKHWGAGVTGWYSVNNTLSHHSILGSVYYTLLNTMVNNQSASVYLCGSFGGGGSSDSTEKGTGVTVTSLSVGVYQQGGLVFGNADNSFINLEVGLGNITHDNSDKYTGIVLKFGQVFFF